VKINKPNDLPLGVDFKTNEWHKELHEQGMIHTAPID